MTFLPYRPALVRSSGREEGLHLPAADELERFYPLVPPVEMPVAAKGAISGSNRLQKNKEENLNNWRTSPHLNTFTRVNETFWFNKRM